MKAVVPEAVLPVQIASYRSLIPLQISVGCVQNSHDILCKMRQSNLLQIFSEKIQ